MVTFSRTTVTKSEEMTGRRERKLEADRVGDWWGGSEEKGRGENRPSRLPIICPLLTSIPL
jgi:hypothetical protein